MSTLTAWAYLATTVLFILGVMRLRSPATARSGNFLLAAGMLVALVVTFVDDGINPWPVMTAAVVLGGVAGTVSARLVRMTAMPQMVALFNGMGGGAAALVSAGETIPRWFGGSVAPNDAAAAVALFTVAIGSISFAGSLIAFLKLQEWMETRPITYRGQHWVNAVLLAVIVGVGVYLIAAGSGGGPWFLVFLGASVLLALSVVVSIGGADMPVVISLLNALTGLAAAATGFLLANNVLIIAGALVGASGTILTQLMSRAMNRPLSNVLFGAFGQIQAGAGPATVTGTVQTADVEDVAMLLAYARRVIAVPGYGLAVARAQQEVRQLMEKLEARGVDFRFAIHPVAGRMPGHMNVLLAEANVPYDKLYEMEAINPEFPNTDVALVIGANDVTNPAARNEPNSPLYGMPILNVDQAARIIVLKRSMNPGFAGIDNPLYTNPKTSMLFGDAKESLTKLIRALDEV
ncbi:MAG: NAD(P)(+) transhydrogenase (Re/Si-specific) subunit beta [Actinomycetia bacterium]|nr:NAD(P)(+) transhydrogenase (Re/Si-specific) subunit beta [Actinomycetes bacterium]